MQKHSLLLSFLAFFISSASVLAFPAKFAVGPDNNQSLLLSTILSAQKNLDINVYQLDHPAIVAAIVDRIKAGVTVNLLIEGHPVGGINPAGKTAIAQLKGAILERNAGDASKSSSTGSHLYLMSAKNKMERRYRFDHAKYMVVDHVRTLISSENLTLGGHSNPGHKGSRGWDVLLEEPGFANELSALFATDVNFRGDILDLTGNPNYKIRIKAPNSDDSGKSNSSTGETILPFPSRVQISSGDVKSAVLITSPDSLAGLVGMIRAAKSTIEVEDMTLPVIWQVGEAKQIEQNPILTALIDASRRGVQVKVLLNDDSVFGKSGNIDSTSHDIPNKTSAPKNEVTRQFIKKLGYCEKLPIAAEVIDVNKAGISYIHNKGFIIDGQKVLISSINGTHNSVVNNREVAVLVESEQAASYFQAVFMADWKNSLLQEEVAVNCLLAFEPGQPNLR
ncbi:MAG: phospholipase D-like domain-containing protein [Bdellovibrionia bacterium]